MARIAYVDHSFHRTTKSTGFLPELLRRYGHVVDFFWDDAWKGGEAVRWRTVADHDVVIMFQSYCPPEDTYFRRQHPNVVYIPMLDQFGVWQGPLHNLSAFWEPFQGSKVLNFSNAVHCMVTAFGIASHFVRYYQPVADYPAPPERGLHGFFWLRRELDLPWQVIRKLIAGHRFDSFHVHLASDPGFASPRLPSDADSARHNISTSTWFEHKGDLDALMARANVYFAPRLEEGIGQSFLEGMMRGQCVVAPNQGTMNEYIVPGVNGLLYDPRHPKALDFSNAAQLGRQARIGACHGRALWEQAEGELMRFVLAPSRDLYVNRYQHPGLQAAVPVPSPVVQPAAQTDRPVRLQWLRTASKRYALLRSTRFLWQPLKNVVSKAARTINR